MKTIQMEIDEDLLAEVERAIRESGTTRSEFICNSLRWVLKDSLIPALEKKHREGYKKYPVTAGEFDAWETEQGWGDQ